jgi:hypothetical protein
MATIHGAPDTSARSDPQQQQAILVVIENLPIFSVVATTIATAGWPSRRKRAAQ